MTIQRVKVNMPWVRWSELPEDEKKQKFYEAFVRAPHIIRDVVHSKRMRMYEAFIQEGWMIVEIESLEDWGHKQDLHHHRITPAGLRVIADVMESQDKSNNENEGKESDKLRSNTRTNESHNR